MIATPHIDGETIMEALLETWSPIAIISFALSPIFISLCALGAAIWSGIAQRTHNRLSVRPVLGFQFDEKGFHLALFGKNPMIDLLLESHSYPQKE